ncbi:hypothetical protein L226DRAFT_457423 [Lentinus tigrinus ALCF2SS1-7]|uniref:uncharacterized protein n=1 Tax=Lentinus tigrinus ALCF2SS1-7 TaxID=1328758 RepID=UPI001165F739|nr:hypothetical protein L226DRAFT_457423 [Lentinus tigrinus ALCF2SS1-7]
MHDPSASTPTTAVDMKAVYELLSSMNITYGTMFSFRTLNEQSAQVCKLGPTMDTAKEELVVLRREIKAHDTLQEERVADVRKMIKVEIKELAGKALREQIHEQIKLEVAKQVKEQMEAQIHEHLPVPLAQQAEESRHQIVEVTHALENSEARRKNANLRPSPSNLSDALEVVLKPDGTKSKLYPANLRSLFAYDNTRARELLKDFGLHDHGVLEKNLNRFMAHIGIRFELVPVSANSMTSPRRRVADVPPATPAK